MRLLFPAIFFLALPFTSVFSINRLLSLTIVTTVLLSILLVLRYSLVSIPAQSATQRSFSSFLIYVAVSALIVVLISTLLSGAASDVDRAGHIVSRLSYGILIICMMLIGIATSRCSELELRVIMLLSYAVVFVFCLIDFAQLYGYTSYLLPRVEVETLEATFNQLFLRARGPAEEPGHLAAYFAATLPLVLEGARRPYLLLSVIALMVFAFTFSTAFVFWFVAFVFMSVIFKAILSNQAVFTYKKLYILLLQLLIFTVGMGVVLFFTEDALGVVRKMGSGSLTDRTESLAALTYFTEHPFNLFFGLGPGVYKSLETMQPMNFFASTLLELGLFGVAVIVVLISGSLLYLTKRGFVFLSSGLISFLIFYTSILNYWYPYFSLPIVYILFVSRSKSDLATHKITIPSC